MASVKVAVRVRPFNQREKDMNAKLIVQMEGKKTRLMTVKSSKEQNDGSREKYKDFTFDHSYWSFDSEDSHYAAQEQVFSDLGVDVIDSAFEGYNACVFAYGQTGSGKTFTMMGSSDFQGLIPRICRQLFARMAAGKESGASYRTEVSYLEIYNEKVKDLLASDAGHTLKVREHPKLGPYVQDLSKHLVSDYDDIQECMHRGNLHRTTASTQMNDVSSRSHAIFTITFVQASYLRHNNMPSETVSKVHLVDLAGSERADATGATGQRLVEGAHINKSLVTLGSVISALADSSHQAFELKAQKGSVKKTVFIPYRDSVLTWLLKDSLGGNSKTIMIAAISPADCNYGETLSTLRYANRAKNIINKPTINEDPNVKLIRELRDEIDKLRKQIAHNTDPIDSEAGVLATLRCKEAQEKHLTEKWTEKWQETQAILHEQQALGLRKAGLGVVLDSDMPHLVGIDDNLFSTGVTLYHLKEGETTIGSAACVPTPDIVLRGAGVLPQHARVRLRAGEALLEPAPGAPCWLNTVPLDKPAKLSQGCILLLGRTNMFRYNDPAEAAKLRSEGSSCNMNLSRLSLLSWSATDLAASNENLNNTDIESDVRCEKLEAQRLELERERQQFLQQQEERQQRWRAEREELLQAQRKLDEERSAMEREYLAACRRLSGGWAARRRALRRRQRQLAERHARLAARADDHSAAAANEESHATTLRASLDTKREELEEFARSTLSRLVQEGKVQSSSPSPESPETSAEYLLQLLLQCDPETADSVRGTISTHKKQLTELEEELSSRTAAADCHRGAAARLAGELALLATQQRGLQHALAADTDVLPGEESEGVKRSKSELVLRARELDAPDPLSADEREHYRDTRLNLSLSLEPLSGPSPPELSFHTAASTPKSPPALAASAPASPAPPAAPSLPDEPLQPKFKLGPVNGADDSDDMSSTEDYNKPRIVEGQSSSSMERSPDERHQRAKNRRRVSEGRGRRVTEGEALRAMQRLCARIAEQKMLVISSLENDCSKDELDRQIQVLQDLQKKYVRLEMALQYSLFSPPRHPPIQEASLPEGLQPAPADPLHRLKEQEIEGSDNVSTSNDELPSEASDCSRRARAPALPDPTIEPEILSYPVDFSAVVSIPGWVWRGAGAGAHHEYEVRVSAPPARVLLLRRYRRFRDLRAAMTDLYGNKVLALPFPGRVPWPSERVATLRRGALQAWLVALLALCAADPRCPLHRQPLSHHALVSFSPFFRKGVFESGKCGTG